jgi:hypothetical protein
MGLLVFKSSLWDLDTQGGREKRRGVCTFISRSWKLGQSRKREAGDITFQVEERNTNGLKHNTSEHTISYARAAYSAS